MARMRTKRNIPARMEKCHERWFDAPMLNRGKWREACGFAEDVPVWLEIGCGKGKFCTEMALRHPEVLSDDVSEKDQHAAPAEDSFFDSYSIEKLKETIRMLPAKQRDALYLHVTENMSVKEIASLLGLSSETVKKRIQRARKKLRELMGECDG